ncbi:putative metal dependent phosphohydrolase [Alkaliphilus metalliredigens QYMF]|uniref:Putative metal dependent phosphohydrolase n=1 Tax=Alkaliphilus metalliredigens (strain QYMF) TaxID=293826 RepID=A6TUE3_ALKMQ|nr:HD domain-containing protein [Alkaliphilus metalliredigens]ABR49811.1 putative metal dependent phosphohydrolase [Alkaliphilus metalliredigens QYMF]
MLYRVKQFTQGVTAKVLEEDHAFIERHLNTQESALFYELRISEQRHSLNVAYGCQSNSPQNIMLIRGALLHDIGKIGSNLTLLNKSFVVMAIKLNLKESLLPSFVKKALYFKYHHPLLGYEMLKSIELEEDILRLVRDHHLPNEDHWEPMTILQHFDELN